VKKRRIIVVVASIVLILSVFLIVNKLVIVRTIPHVSFMYNISRAKCFYICSNGDIYASTSEESFEMEFSELIECIKQKEYEDILIHVGNTDGRRVRKMYRLFLEVVVNEDYGVRPERYYGPQTEEYGGTEALFGGIYYDENRVPTYDTIYISNAGRICSDERAYEIVDWMYDVLKDYMN